MGARLYSSYCTCFSHLTLPIPIRHLCATLLVRHVRILLPTSLTMSGRRRPVRGGMPRVSYREPSEFSSSSSEEDDTESHDGFTHSTVRAHTSMRTRSSGAADEDPSYPNFTHHTASRTRSDDSPQTSGLLPRNSNRTRQDRIGKRKRAPVAYRESSSSEETESDIVATPRSAPRRTSMWRNTNTDKAAPGRPKRNKQPARPKSKTLPPPTSRARILIESDGIVPDWQALPYEVLLAVFRFAIHPLHDNSMRATGAAGWAIRAALVCKSFAEPVLSALYESPPLHSIDQPHSLLQLLRSAQPTYINYRQKIKRLELDTTLTLAFSAYNVGQIRLGDLVSELPALTDVDISNARHRPPYRDVGVRGQWNYPRDLFEKMSAAGTRLHWWRCCARMIQAPSKPYMDSIFLEPCFHSLKHLTLSHMYLDVEEGRQQPASIQPTALQSLTHLRSLNLEACEIHYSWDLLNHLPNHLYQLSVIYCTSFNADALNPFLMDHGEELRQLVLSHNNCLDLSFLPNLKSSCPRLEVLRTDLTYYSSALLFQNADAEPLYNTLLEAGQVPTWPTTLREIDMLHLRKWDPEAAIAFLESLSDAAPQLLELRSLTLKAMINVSWRGEQRLLQDKVSRCC